MILLSIIIPCYNAEKYLKDCLDSILINNADNYEIILIDDGSGDNTFNICREYRNNYANIQLLSQNNSGVSIARNNAIKVAKGKYIMFIDSDDKLLTGWQEIINNNLLINSDEDVIYFSKILNNIDTNKDEILKLICCFNKNNIGFGAVYSKLFKNDFIEKNNLKFQADLINGEDMLFNIEALSKLKSYKCIHDSFYLYRQYQGSSTKKFDLRIIENDLIFNQMVNNILAQTTANVALHSGICNFFLENGILGIFNRLSYLPDSEIKYEYFDFLNNDIYKNCLNNNVFNINKEKIILLKLIKKKRYRLVLNLYKIKRRFKQNKNKEVYNLI